jgi:hypothetical protein
MSRRRRLIAASSGTACVGLAVALIVTLNGNAALIKPSSGSFPHVAAPRLPHIKAPPRHKQPLTSPFTGERIKKLGPELVVKIDNIVYARPQTGLQSADIVYVLPVEGGLSRFEVVFSSRFPKVIGPVRSAREDDLELLRQFGRPAFAFSGAAPHLLPFIERAHIVDLYAGFTRGYFRSGSRIAPYNLYADTKVLMSQAKHASKARDIGFRFSAWPSAGGRPRQSYSAAYPAARYTFRWAPKQKRYRVWIDGKPAMATEGGQLGGRTIVIQYTTIRTSRFLEYGFPPPYAQSDGSGRAVVLRNGRAYNVHWSRPKKGGGTVYTLPNGKRMTFAIGRVWVMFAGKWPRNSPG